MVYSYLTSLGEINKRKQVCRRNRSEIRLSPKKQIKVSGLRTLWRAEEPRMDQASLYKKTHGVRKLACALIRRSSLQRDSARDARIAL
jgi:hypothetical protein